MTRVSNLIMIVKLKGVMLRNEAQDHDCIGWWMCRVPVTVVRGNGRR